MGHCETWSHLDLLDENKELLYTKRTLKNRDFVDQEFIEYSRFRNYDCCAFLTEKHNTRSLNKFRYLKVYIPLEKTKYTEDEVKKYIEFISDAGVKASYVGITQVPDGEYLDSVYSGKGYYYLFRPLTTELQDKTCYEVHLDAEDYKNYVSFLAGYTIVRYLWGGNFMGVATLAMKIYDECKEYMDRLQAIQLALYSLSTNDHYENYSLLNFDLCDSQEVHKLVPYKEAFESLDKLNNIHSAFQQLGELDITSGQVKKLLDKKEFKQLLVLFKLMTPEEVICKASYKLSDSVNFVKNEVYKVDNSYKHEEYYKVKTSTDRWVIINKNKFKVK